jgi:acetylornithine/N-succinyldiaminopimelate aminotransferase
MDFQTIKKTDNDYIASTYGRFNVAIKSGKGATAVDYDGKKYIDFTSGIGVNSLGWCDEGWQNAVISQLKSVQHTSNLYYTEAGAVLAELLCTASGYSKVVFGNSGAEANECAIKAARKYAYDKYGAGRSTIITLVNSFHGRTVTTLSATGQEGFHQYFYPFTEGFRYVKAGDIEELKQNIDGSVCGVMVEFIQGEGGVCPLDADFVKTAFELCEKNDMAFIADEVQTGIGRTGSFLCSEQFGVFPHITSLAKGLGGGLPIGAVLLCEKYKDVFAPGDHGSTFGANPVVCAGGCEVVRRISDKEFLNGVKKRGEIIRERLSGLNEVEKITGLGMMIGISLKTKNAKDVANQCAENGLLVLTAKEKIRLLPPLNISGEELSQGLDILVKVLKK